MARYAILHIPSGTVISQCKSQNYSNATSQFENLLWEFSVDKQRQRGTKYFYDRPAAEKFLRKLLVVFYYSDVSKKNPQYHKPDYNKVKYYKSIHISRSLALYFFCGFSTVLKDEQAEDFALTKKQFCIITV